MIITERYGRHFVVAVHMLRLLVGPFIRFMPTHYREGLLAIFLELN